MERMHRKEKQARENENGKFQTTDRDHKLFAAARRTRHHQQGANEPSKTQWDLQNVNCFRRSRSDEEKREKEEKITRPEYWRRMWQKEWKKIHTKAKYARVQESFDQNQKRILKINLKSVDQSNASCVRTPTQSGQTLLIPGLQS